MKNYVWQKFGVSTDYNTVVQHPWHSTGQGAAKVALQYIVLSDTMIGAYHNKIALNCLYDPMCLLLVIHSLNKAFIDDVILHSPESTQHSKHPFFHVGNCTSKYVGR